MITRAQMLADAAGLVFDSERQLIAVMALEPDRAATARTVLADAVRVHMLLSTRLPLRRVGPEIRARLIRANLLTEALNAPVQ